MSIAPVTEHRVFGPPGTGKTTFLARNARSATEKVGRSKVMIASLTRAAAEEVGSRDTGIPPHNVGTLHAHAYRALDRPALAESGPGLNDWNRWCVEHGYIGAWRIDPGAGARDPEWAPSEAIRKSENSGHELLQDIATHRARQTPEELWSDKLRHFWSNWCEWKTARGQLDFTDLIEYSLEEIEAPNGEPEILMVDEAQDLSALEFALVRKWAATADQVVVVGDPDQCLYGWRGTDPEAMIRGEAASERTLSQSYRVPAAVHSYAVDWIEKTPIERKETAYEPRLRDFERPELGPEPGEVTFTGHTWRQPEGLLKRLLEDADRGETSMVIATCSFMLDPLVATMKTRGVPFANPFRPTHGGWNPLARGAERLLAFLQPDDSTHGQNARMWTWADMHRWAGPMRAQGVLSRGAKTLIKVQADKFPDVEVSMTDLTALFASEEALENAIDLNADWWRENLLKDAKRVSGYPAKVRKKRGGAALLERPKIIVGTIHSVKGGEADNVYVFPDMSRAGFESSWMRQRDRAPTYRLFYVAFTRAKRRLTICAPSSADTVRLPRGS